MSAPTSPKAASDAATDELAPSSTADAATNALADLRLDTFDPLSAARPATPPINSPTLNGVHHISELNGIASKSSVAPPVDEIHALRTELQRTRDEKQALEDKYQSLLGKVTALRTTLGAKLKQDSEELDRRAQALAQLAAENEDYRRTVETLQTELVASNADAEAAAHELDVLRGRAAEESAHDAFVRERELREVQGELERCRMDRDEWERSALEDRVRAEEARLALHNARRDLEIEREGREREADELEQEREKSANLQSVLEDFQSVKELELRHIVSDFETRLHTTTGLLAEFKSRALTAEVALEDAHGHALRTSQLEQELKDKNALVGKLRYDGVILNEHLTEALRRLRKSSSDTNVDRRLVTNVLLTFLATPRTDGKRFEMLALLAGVLGWSDAEREHAGLQRGSGAVPRGSVAAGTGAGKELERSDETESFSKMWVEFLLKEAAQGTAGPAPTPPSHPGTPGSGPAALPRTSSFAARSPPPRLPSFGAPAGTFAIPPQRRFSLDRSPTDGTARPPLS